MAKRWILISLIGLALSALSCSDGPAPAPPPACDQKCKDGVGLRAMREMMKLIFNLTLQGKPVGTYDISSPCPRGGSARIFGTATSNAFQGSTEVKLTYEIRDCQYVQKDDDANENYSITVSGTITQEGTMAVQPSATTALLMKSNSITLAGSVYDPPDPYEAKECPLDIFQNGNRVAGTMCGREVGFDF
jgi:hypothetical protein